MGLVVWEVEVMVYYVVGVVKAGISFMFNHLIKTSW